MIRLFNVHYPLRTLILVVGEASIVWASLLLGTMLRYREDSYLVLNFEYGYYKIWAVTLVVLLLSHWFDLYDPTHFDAKGELYFRLLLIPGLLALALGALGAVFPRLGWGTSLSLFGLMIVTIALLAWRSAYSWLSRQSYFRDRVYVLGAGERAQRLVSGLRRRPELGVDVVGWTGELDGAMTRERLACHLRRIARERSIHYVIVAMQDRRDAMPMQQLLQLRLRTAVRIEEATSWLEKISGKIEIETLYPSWIIYADGFHLTDTLHFGKRVLHFAAGLITLLVALPLIPFIVLAVKLDSSGPVLYRQKRVGRGGKTFYCYKFRTMRPDAEADIGPTWADDDDPRITRVGKFLRVTRLDEIPQVWCVLKGDMAFVGPRPERPEFVEWLTEEIPYYSLRHLVPPGITGWAQIRYKYGNTVGDAKEKLQYDLFYIKNASIGLDILIMFQTIKILLQRRGGQ
ncbi:MAG TPA: TIGR03013 family XrtA/PEP-CTERM system glycosyltransferase [Verrucomicrobiae bacterium]|nr:TIGR03013 family XrtA/PEP-CTERM system glycosyltransferase [Verrucomicrobiae bacterium]